MFFIMIILWLIYYAIKGISIKDKQIALAMGIFTTIPGIICFFIASDFQNLFFRYLFMLYFVYSIGEYILFKIKKIKAPMCSIFSVFYLDSNDISVRYVVLRIPILIIVNIYLKIKRKPLLNLNDSIEINIQEKKGSTIQIRL